MRGVCRVPSGRRAAGSQHSPVLFHPLPHRLPQWELFVGLKPKGVHDVADFARNHLCGSSNSSSSSSSIFSSLIVIFILISLSPSQAEEGRQPASWWGWRCQLYGERQEFSSPWTNPALLRGWLPFAHLCGFQLLEALLAFNSSSARLP